MIATPILLIKGSIGRLPFVFETLLWLSVWIFGEIHLGCDIFDACIFIDLNFDMSINLSTLPASEKNTIELDKQASFLVWKLKQGKAVASDIDQQAAKIIDQQEQALFLESVAKYKRVMGVV